MSGDRRNRVFGESGFKETLMKEAKLKKFLILATGWTILCGACFGAEVTVGPYVHFYERGEVAIFWKTDTATASTVDYGIKPDMSLRVEESTAKTDHELVVPVKPVTLYNYRIMIGSTAEAEGEFYTAFDYGPEPFPAGPSPYPTDSLTPLYAQAADYIAAQLQFSKGYCIDYGCGEGRLAYELAKRTDLKIIGFEDDPVKVAAARNALHDADIYGARVTVMQADLSSLDCSDYSANLIVSDRMIASGTCPGTASEMFRVLRPDGGLAMLGQPPDCPSALSEGTLDNWLGAYGDAVASSNGVWTKIERGALPGAGEWSHNWANPAATTCSDDTDVAYPVKMLWYGQPGPRYIIDRHHRPGCSLYKKGHLVVPGLHRVMAVDAYNGSRLWDLAVGNSGRVGVLKDAGWVALASDYVYAAASDDCVGLDAETGRPTLFFAAPQPISGETLDWGYLATEGDQLIGSGQKAGASRIGHSFDLGAGGHISQVYHDNQTIICSRYLFGLDRDDDSAAPVWVYKRGSGAASAIPNPAICVTSDAVYFIESRNSSAYNDSDGRVTLGALFSGNNEYLVKVSRSDGSVVWAKQFNFPFQHVVWLQYADGKVFASGTWGTAWTYGVYAFKASDGSLDPAWSTNPRTFNAAMSDGYHGGQDKHPAIVGNSIYWQPNFRFNVQTGSSQSWSGGTSQSNCGTMATSANYAFNRGGGNPRMSSLSGGGWTLCSETRVGCYINIVPAGGLVLVPESGSGCVCSYSMQASMAFMPY